MRKTPEEIAFFNARTRCTCKRASYYKDYGGRGIQFKFRSIDQWLKELGPRPSSKHSVHRINNNGHYKPGNIRWATRKEQGENRRPVKNTSNMSAAAKARCTPKWRAAVSRRVKKQHAAGKLGHATWKPESAERQRRKMLLQGDRISARMKKLWRGPIGERLRKIHRSPSTRRKHKEAALRRSADPKYIAKISGKNHWNYGKPGTMLGRKWNKESKRRMHFVAIQREAKRRRHGAMHKKCQ